MQCSLDQKNRNKKGGKETLEKKLKRQTVQYKPDHGCLANMGQLLRKKNVEHPKLCKFFFGKHLTRTQTHTTPTYTWMKSIYPPLAKAKFLLSAG